MRFSDIVTRSSPLTSEQIYILRTECSQFLRESGGIPVYKSINDDRLFARHKARYSKDYIGHFLAEDCDVTRRAIVPSNTSNGNVWFFPTNGYKYVYSQVVNDYKHHITTLREYRIDGDIISELHQSAFSSGNLCEALTHYDTEILWYKIPCYYTVDRSKFQNYNQLLNIL